MAKNCRVISSSFTWRVAERGIIIIAFYAFFYYIRWFKKSTRLLLLILVLFGSFGPISGLLYEQEMNLIPPNISAFLKIIYGPLLAMLFFIFIKKFHISTFTIFKMIAIAGFVAGLFLIIAKLGSFGKLTYGEYAYGSTGLFWAQNDLSLTLGIIWIISFYLVLSQPTIINLVGGILIVIGISMIGTRASLIGLIMLPPLVFLIRVWSISENRGKKIFRYISILFLLVSLIGYTLQDVFTKISEYQYQQEKIESLLEGKLPRELLITAGFTYLKQRPFWFNIFGEGAANYQQGVYGYWEGFLESKRRLVEVDWIDIFGGYGLIFTILIHWFYLSFLIYSAKIFVSKRSQLHGIIALSLGFYLSHSAFAGHALGSPMPSGIVAALIGILLFLSSQQKSKLKTNTRNEWVVFNKNGWGNQSDHLILQGK